MIKRMQNLILKANLVGLCDCYYQKQKEEHD